MVYFTLGTITNRTSLLKILFIPNLNFSLEKRSPLRGVELTLATETNKVNASTDMVSGFPTKTETRT
jgi:hypothetical protein